MIDPDELAPAIARLFPEARLLPSHVWAVGGVIRDFLLEGTPLDLDLACNHAQGVATAFASAVSGTLVDLGRETFPTFRVVAAGRIFDFSELTEGSIDADLGRRDFTINAMAFELTTESFVDPGNGMADLRLGMVRMVREQNLVDDPLRILKGIRTACTLDFAIDKETFAAMTRHRELIRNVAAERIRSELVRALDSSRPATAIRLLRETGIDRILIDERGGSDDAEQTCAGLPTGHYLLALALWLRNLSSEESSAVSSRLRLSQSESSGLLAIRSLAQAASTGHDDELRLAAYDRGALVAGLTVEFLRRTAQTAAADRLARLTIRPDFFETAGLLDGVEIGRIAGIPAGPEIGRIKRHLVTEQLSGRISNRDGAIAFVRSLSTNERRR